MLNRLHNYEEYKIRVDPYKKGKYFTNCYFLPGKIKQLIEEKKIYILESENNIYLLEKEECFYRLYFCIKNIDNLQPLQLGLPLVIEYPYKGVFSERQHVEIEIIQKLGFSLGRESRRMSAKSQNIKVSESLYINEKFMIDFAIKDNIDVVADILHHTFSPLYSYLPTKAMLNELLDQKKILVITINGEIAGILNMDIVKNISWIRQLAIVEKFRGRGYGWLLLNYYHMLFKDEVLEFMQWVDLSNVSAIRLYEKAGYKFDDLRANEYINNIL